MYMYVYIYIYIYMYTYTYQGTLQSAHVSEDLIEGLRGVTTVLVCIYQSYVYIYIYIYMFI